MRIATERIPVGQQFQIAIAQRTSRTDRDRELFASESSFSLGRSSTARRPCRNASSFCPSPSSCLCLHLSPSERSKASLTRGRSFSLFFRQPQREARHPPCPGGGGVGGGLGFGP